MYICIYICIYTYLYRYICIYMFALDIYPGFLCDLFPGNYIASNKPWVLEFLRYWAHFRFRQPSGFSSADNGALHLALLEMLELPQSSEVQQLYSNLTATGTSCCSLIMLCIHRMGHSYLYMSICLYIYIYIYIHIYIYIRTHISLLYIMFIPIFFVFGVFRIILVDFATTTTRTGVLATEAKFGILWRIFLWYLVVSKRCVGQV